MTITNGRTVMTDDGTTLYAVNDAGTLETISAGGSGAPVGAQYIVLAPDETLTAERRALAGTGILFSDGGANGNLTISHNTGNFGNVHTNYLQKAGDTMTGALVMSGTVINMNGNSNIVNCPHITRSGSVPDTTAAFIDLATGGTLTLNTPSSGTVAMATGGTGRVFVTSTGLHFGSLASIPTLQKDASTTDFLILVGATWRFGSAAQRWPNTTNSSPGTGDFWWDAGTNTLRFRVSGQTKQISWVNV